jgi:predicted metal-dependent phosphotriesterase family hydrolase
MKRHVIPELRALGASEADIDMLFVHNPRRFLFGA